ncbi:MAG TPA: RsmB/NOP family class I SAM-dependent RNA methyltransferase, partial [Chthonomonadaceae bacterium]|nr:RsmB/NOP family class I SAM-dependent RNA methyltransferase [Chthonomonadaceae bacterium]
KPGAMEPREPLRGASDRALKAAAAILARWEAERARSPLDRVVEAEFRARRTLNASERRWAGDLVFNTVRFLRRQTWLLDALALPITPESLAWLGACAPGTPDGTRTLLPLSFARTSALAPPEAAAAALTRLPAASEPSDFLRVTLSFPDPLAEALEAQLGPEAVAAGIALNAPAPVTLRVNTLRVRREQAQSALPDARPTRYSPWGLELPRRVNLYELPGFRQGWYEVQEEASQLTALLADPHPGQTVVEVGAGAGGKTLALAALMQDRGRLVALDPSEARLLELRKRARRAGVHNVQARALPATAEGEWLADGALQWLRGRADVVFCDVPCTGSGILRRNPDAKWRLYDLAAFARQQQRILAQAGALVAPGGSLLYVTCAFERIQDEAVVEAFLASPAGQDFTIEPVAPRLISACRRAASLAAPQQPHPQEQADLAGLTCGPYLRSWPHRHGLDAFFAACLRKGKKRSGDASREI